MWLLDMKQTNGVAIKYARNGREYRLPEFPHFSVDGYCAETNTVYAFFGCHLHGCRCQLFVTSSPQMETPWELDTTIAR